MPALMDSHPGTEVPEYLPDMDSPLNKAHGDIQRHLMRLQRRSQPVHVTPHHDPGNGANAAPAGRALFKDTSDLLDDSPAIVHNALDLFLEIRGDEDAGVA